MLSIWRSWTLSRPVAGTSETEKGWKKAKSKEREWWSMKTEARKTNVTGLEVPGPLWRILPGMINSFLHSKLGLDVSIDHAQLSKPRSRAWNCDTTMFPIQCSLIALLLGIIRVVDQFNAIKRLATMFFLLHPSWPDSNPQRKCQRYVLFDTRKFSYQSHQPWEGFVKLLELLVTARDARY